MPVFNSDGMFGAVPGGTNQLFPTDKDSRDSDYGKLPNPWDAIMKSIRGPVPAAPRRDGQNTYATMGQDSQINYRLAQTVGDRIYRMAYGDASKRYPIIVRDRAEMMRDRGSVGFDYRGSDDRIELAEGLEPLHGAHVLTHERIGKQYADHMGNHAEIIRRTDEEFAAYCDRTIKDLFGKKSD